MPEEPVLVPRQTPLPPVPTPWRIRLRELRVMVLPPLMFTLSTALAFWLWTQAAPSSGIAGMGEGVRSLVASPYAGSVHQLLAQPYQFVHEGDAVAVIEPIDPRMDMDLLQAELDLARLQLQPTPAEDNAVAFERLRVDLLRTRSELAMARVNLARAENLARRQQPLFAEKLVSEDVFDLSVKTRDMYAAEVFEKSNAVAQIEARLGDLRALGWSEQGMTNAAQVKALDRLRTLQQSAATNWGPVTLRAPISGMVTTVHRREGENVAAGEILLTISSLTSDRVVGYLRQPYPVEPRAGLAVQVTTRERRPRRFTGLVTEIGAQVEIITNALAVVRPNALVDSGLPIIVQLDEAIRLRPGEIVDLHFEGLAGLPESVALTNAALRRRFP